MAVKQFLLPDLGEGLTEADLISWKVRVGDEVKLNQVLADVETAKAMVELPSPFEGTVVAPTGSREFDCCGGRAAHLDRGGRCRARHARQSCGIRPVGVGGPDAAPATLGSRCGRTGTRRTDNRARARRRRAGSPGRGGTAARGS